MFSRNRCRCIWIYASELIAYCEQKSISATATYCDSAEAFYLLRARAFKTSGGSAWHLMPCNNSNKRIRNASSRAPLPQALGWKIRLSLAAMRAHRFAFCDRLHAIDCICSCRWLGARWAIRFEPNPYGHADVAQCPRKLHRWVSICNYFALPSIAGSNANHLNSVLKCTRRACATSKKVATAKSVQLIFIELFILCDSFRTCQSDALPSKRGHT